LNSRQAAQLFREPIAEMLADRANSRAAAVEYSGNFLPPSPPAQKATARQDHARQTSSCNGSRNGKTGDERGFVRQIAVTDV
jgi:hypothetical protein